MEDKQDGIWNCKIIISHYDIFWEKQTQKQISYQEKIMSTPQMTIKTYRC